jgi:Pyruvate/2-oxoacid:ferredoxin oxidoreductase delta subunit
LQSHAKTSCLGYLSEEHFIALLCFVEGGVQINLTGCRQCRNRAVVALLERRLSSVRAKLPSLEPERLKLVQDEAELDFQPVSYSRRQFVLAFRDFALRGRAVLLSKVEGPTPLYFSDKLVPQKRVLLNLALEKCSNRDDETAVEISSGYYYRAVVDENCNLCPACAAVCPTGALREGRESARRTLDFDASRCVGCDLCARFCGSKSIIIEKSQADLTAKIKN